MLFRSTDLKRKFNGETLGLRVGSPGIFPREAKHKLIKRLVRSSTLWSTPETASSVQHCAHMATGRPLNGGPSSGVDLRRCSTSSNSNTSALAIAPTDGVFRSSHSMKPRVELVRPGTSPPLSESWGGTGNPVPWAPRRSLGGRYLLRKSELNPLSAYVFNDFRKTGEAGLRRRCAEIPSRRVSKVILSIVSYAALYN